MLQVNWQAIFTTDTSLLEIFIRGTLTYLIIFTLLRIVVKRQAGTVAISDLLVIVLLADAAQNGMAGGYHSLTDGIALVSTIIFWSYVLDWLAYHFPLFRRFVHPPPLLLVKDGQLQRQNMKRELVTKEELMSELRQQGVNSLDEVKQAFMEGDGHFSIVKYDQEQHQEPKKDEST